jgi:hypothetical protein
MIHWTEETKTEPASIHVKDEQTSFYVDFYAGLVTCYGMTGDRITEGHMTNDDAIAMAKMILEKLTGGINV